MKEENLESEFVRQIMKGSSEEEIEEATERWFDFLKTIDQIVQRYEREGRCTRCGETRQHREED